MKQLTIKEIENKLNSGRSIEKQDLDLYRNDARKGVQELIAKLEKKLQTEQEIRLKFDNMLHYEKASRKDGFQAIAGVDEVGRGPLAGPVVTAAVILPADFYLPGLNDSKKVNAKLREQFYLEIERLAVAIGIGIVEPTEIDRMNIYQATKKAMIMAVEQLEVCPDFVLIDAMEIPIHIPQKKIIKGDEKSISIAAASIIAKVTRDNMMKEIAETYPQYGFENHMGYATKEHLHALEKFGYTPCHRRSFSPISEMVRSAQ